MSQPIEKKYKDVFLKLSGESLSSAFLLQYFYAKSSNDEFTLSFLFLLKL